MPETPLAAFLLTLSYPSALTQRVYLPVGFALLLSTLPNRWLCETEVTLCGNIYDLLHSGSCSHDVFYIQTVDSEYWAGELLSFQHENKHLANEHW